MVLLVTIHRNRLIHRNTLRIAIYRIWVGDACVTRFEGLSVSCVSCLRGEERILVAVARAASLCVGDAGQVRQFKVRTPTNCETLVSASFPGAGAWKFSAGLDGFGAFISQLSAVFQIKKRLLKLAPLVTGCSKSREFRRHLGRRDQVRSGAKSERRMACCRDVDARISLTYPINQKLKPEWTLYRSRP